MAQEKVEVAEVVAKVAEGKELTPQEEKAIMETNDNVLVEDRDEKTPAPDPESKTPEKDGEEEKKGEPEAEPEDTDGEKEGEDTEETPSEKEEADPSEADKQKDDAQARLEKELEKPYGEEDLSDYSPRERALFYEMRRERRKRQEKQEELDLLRFKQMKEKVEEKPDAKEKEEVQDKDPFEGKDEDEFLTIGDVKNLLKKQAPKASTKQESELADLNRKLLMRNWFLEGQMRHDDFMDVVNMAPEVLDGDKDAAIEIMETAKRGGNAALTTYNLVKSSKRFKGNEAPAERDVNKERADRIKQNEKKPRTTGGSGSGTLPAGEYTYEELVNMPEEEFMKIKPEKRNKLLKKLEGLM